MRRHATQLETVSLVVHPDALEFYLAAVEQVCGASAVFLDESTGLWTVEGVKDQGDGEAELASALAMAELATGFAATLERRPTEAEGWLERTFEAFPEQLIGRGFAVRGTHIHDPLTPGRTTLILDAAAAFGSGEHGSTRGCLRALEYVLQSRRPRRIIDVGTGTGILAMAAARLLHRPVLATDIDPWSVRVARSNAQRNQLGRTVRYLRADGWTSPAIEHAAPYDLVFANILARPLTRMAKHLALHLAPGGTVILAGLLDTQVNWVRAAHRHHGLVQDRVFYEARWATLVLRKREGIG